jgi:GNAT superfamily N-acetyltransferase
MEQAGAVQRPVVRRARSDDASAISEVVETAIRESAAETYTPAQLEAWAAGGSRARVVALLETSTAFVADVDGQIVGFASLVGDDVDQLYVTPTYGGTGVARQLLEVVENEARRGGIESLTTTASLRAVRAFDDFGFRAIERMERPFNGATFAVVEMTKRLPMPRRPRPDEAPLLADLWLRARRASAPAIPLPVHSDDEVRAWFASVVLPTYDVWLIADGEEPIALLVLDGDWIDQLYVDPTRTGKALGSTLIEVAKASKPERLDLWTFQSNVAAHRFYERHGFIAIAATDGDNEEREPDVHYMWPRG